MATNIKVVLFEDLKEMQARILQALKKYLPEGEVIPFDGSRFTESNDDKKLTYEDRLQKILIKAPYDNATLLVVDEDLSLSKDFGGLSGNAAFKVSRRLAIPVCSYARELKLDDYEWHRLWEEGRIILDLSAGEDEIARRAAIATRGFAEIAARLPEVMAKDPPAKILATLLGKPEYSDKIALYSVGDKHRLTDIPRGDGDAKQMKNKKTAFFLGYWLWDTLLSYPGLFVNETAAASYLNISEDDFRRREVRAVFDGAYYSGPFSDSKEPHWWRQLLDDIVSDQSCDDGLALVQEKLDRKFDPCRCYLDPSKTAGYYCIIAKKPVSLENSKGSLSWLPRGADLARISNPKFEEYAPWFGGA